MSLIDFKPHFDNAYQEVFNKVIVSKEIGNFRFEPTLTKGKSLERVSYSLDNVLVRTVTRGAASTIDTITDTSELFTVNYEKELAFHLSDGEKVQAGDLNPGEVIGGQAAIKLATDFDAHFFGEVANAAYAFDTGDLTTLVSTGVPFKESSTTVPQMATMMAAKLRRNNQTLTNLAFVTDSYGAGLMEQYLLAKDIDIAGSVYANGYAGPLRGAKIYVSENLTGNAVLGLATNPTDTNTIVYNGVTITFVATLTGGASEIHLASTVDITRANLAEWFNAGGASSEAEGIDTGYSAASSADQALLTNITATNDNSANTLTIKQLGSGALVLSETFTDGTDTWTLNFIDAYFGKKGAIDAVMMDKSEVDMRPTSDRRGTNIFSSILGGYKTFTDGSKKFLRVKLSRA